MALTDLASNIIADSEDKLPIDLGPDTVLAWVCDKGDEMLAASGRGRRELVSVGVGLPGPVEFSSGRPINPPIMPGWDDADVAGRLGAHFDAPVLVDNDVNIMALGEHRSEWPDVSDLLFVKVATGIGSGIIADGSLRRGARGAAGDIGHIAVQGRTTSPAAAATSAASRPSPAATRSPAGSAKRASRSQAAPRSSHSFARAISTRPAHSARPGATSAPCLPLASAC